MRIILNIVIISISILGWLILFIGLSWLILYDGTVLAEENIRISTISDEEKWIISCLLDTIKTDNFKSILDPKLDKFYNQITLEFITEFVHSEPCQILLNTRLPQEEIMRKLFGLLYDYVKEKEQIYLASMPQPVILIRNSIVIFAVCSVVLTTYQIIKTAVSLTNPEEVSEIVHEIITRIL